VESFVAESEQARPQVMPSGRNGSARGGKNPGRLGCQALYEAGVPNLYSRYRFNVGIVTVATGFRSCPCRTLPVPGLVLLEGSHTTVAGDLPKGNFLNSHERSSEGVWAW
jgi:hypothetical protein